MNRNNKIITLCGSTKFKNDFLKISKMLTLKGYIVFTPCIFEHCGDEEMVNCKTKQILIDTHKRMIDLSDILFVINKNKYIGNSTKDEIKYALSHNKIINYLEK